MAAVGGFLFYANGVGVSVCAAAQAQASRCAELGNCAHRNGDSQIVNATLCPVVSFRSDRYRSPIATFLAKHGIVSDARFAALIVCGVFTVGFQFFRMFVASVYDCLFNDVVPHGLLGRFLAAFRVVGTLSSSLFSIFFFPHAETHFTEIFTGAAVSMAWFSF